MKASTPYRIASIASATGAGAALVVWHPLTFVAAGLMLFAAGGWSHLAAEIDRGSA